LKKKRFGTYWDEKKELWYISVIDVIEVLTNSIDPQAYWRKLKQRLKEEGNQTVTNLHGLKMQETDRNYQFWERNALSIELQSNEVFIQKLTYIHNNPVKANIF
jgi:hypothetical protein